MRKVVTTGIVLSALLAWSALSVGQSTTPQQPATAAAGQGSAAPVAVETGTVVGGGVLGTGLGVTEAVVLAGTVLLALFVAAGMMILASFARNYKEGQSLVGPFYIALIMPIMFLQTPGIEFTSRIALIPVANVTMMVREAMQGIYHWRMIGGSAAAGGKAEARRTNLAALRDAVAASGRTARVADYPYANRVVFEQ